MKPLSITMFIVSALIISCSKAGGPADPGNVGGPSITPGPIYSTTLNEVAGHWQPEGDALVVSIIPNVITSYMVSSSIKVYVESKGIDELDIMGQQTQFLDGLIWASTADKDVRIHFRGNAQVLPPYLNIKIVISQ